MEQEKRRSRSTSVMPNVPPEFVYSYSRSTATKQLFPAHFVDKNVKTSNKNLEIHSFLRYVTISGLREAYFADKWIGRPFWILVLTTLAGLAARDIFTISSAVLVGNAVRTEEHLRFGQNSLEFGNISICVPVSFDRQQVSEDIVIPEEAWRRMQRQNWSAEYVMEAFTRFFSYYNIYDQENPLNLERILKLIVTDERNGRYVNGFAEAVERYLPSCQETIISCTMAGVPVNCCEIVQVDLSQASICYTIMLNNKDTRFYQTIPGPDGGLTMEVVWNGTNEFYIDNLADEGLYLFAGEMPTLLSMPSVVWPFTHLNVRLELKQRLLLDNCYSNPPPLQYISYYDPTGLNCIWDQAVIMFKAMLGCEMPVPPYVPRMENVCSLILSKIALHLFIGGADGFFNQPKDAILGTILFRAANIIKSILDISGNSSESVEKYLFTLPYCKRLCSYSYYNTIVSYSSLVSNNSDFNEDNTTTLRSRMTVYYGGFDYAIITDQSATNGYVAFAQIGSILGVYAGISVVTFVQVLVYGVDVIYTGFLKPKMEPQS